MRIQTLLPALLLMLMLAASSLTFATPAKAADDFDFAFPELLDVLCDILAAEDIPQAMAAYGPVQAGQYTENVFNHSTWTLNLPGFKLVYDISQELDVDGSVAWEDYIIEAVVEDPGAEPFFHELRQARGWVQELGAVTLDAADQVEVTANPFPGEENMAPLWWRVRVFCDPDGPCRMIRFFYHADTAGHNGAFCR